MNVLFLTQTDQTGASARYRVYQYLSYLEKEGIGYVVSPAVKASMLNRYSNNNINIINKTLYYSSIISQRIIDLKRVNFFDCVFLQRDILVHVYPFLEKLIAVRQKNIIFDFDDAIALYPRSNRTGAFFRFFWDKRKIERIIKLSKHVIVANNNLKKYSEKFTKNITVIPTSIDLDKYRIYNTKNFLKTGATVIGWIGSQGTFSYLEQIFPVFKELIKRYNIAINVIGAKSSELNGMKITYKDWNPDTETQDIVDFDIGVMPLTNDEWSRGKSGTKLLQYMAAGVCSVASPVGINTEIIKDGINGFLADTPEAWIKKISILIENPQLRIHMAANARKDVEKSYSIQANAPRLLNAIKRSFVS